MKALFRNRAEVQKDSWATSVAVEELVTAINTQPLEVGDAKIRSGTGSPEGIVSGSPGDYWMRRDGLAGTVAYFKMSGINTKTGWRPFEETGAITFTDGSGAGLALTVVQAGAWSRIGRQVLATGFVTYPATASGASARLEGLPYTSAAVGFGATIGFQDAALAMTAQVPLSSVAVRFLTTAGGVVTNANLSGKTVNFTAHYLTA